MLQRGNVSMYFPFAMLQRGNVSTDPNARSIDLEKLLN